jgi:Zn-dependent peptidase ImmA (M78 family)
MANTKKMTKKDYFEQIKAKYNLSTDEIAFIDHELELLEKKNAADKKPTATQVANKATMEAILDAMEDNKYYTITEIIKAVPECAEMTNQKVSAIVKQMIDVSVRRVEDKRKAYFVKM